jgi:ubiquinone/menaquinone biosynthesis C-methylase UbiE
MEGNKQLYSSERIVKLYGHLKDPLQKPEQKIIELLKACMGDMKMLDIGVGGGRTTEYLFPLVKEYIGIDYSDKLVSVCQNKFPNINFLTVDARDLSLFADNEFDFVLFSFNGIDYISHEDRMAVLTQIRRIVKSNGYFCFSSHNIRSIDKWKTIPFSFNPLSFAKRLLTYFRRRTINNLNKEKIDELQIADYVIINDGAHYGQLETYYVQAKFQLMMLEKFGFKNTRIFGLKDGEELSIESIENNKDGWLYYLCY